VKKGQIIANPVNHFPSWLKRARNPTKKKTSLSPQASQKKVKTGSSSKGKRRTPHQYLEREGGQLLVFTSKWEQRKKYRKEGLWKERVPLPS